MSDSYELIRPESLDELLNVLSRERERACLVAGGTELMVRKRHGELPPCLLIDTSRLQELRGLREEGGVLSIGAGTTFAELVRSEPLRQGAEALWLAARSVGSPQIRNMGTVGGNLANASPAGDLLPPLYALEAELVLQSASRQRTLPVHEFFLGVNRTALGADELIREVRFKASPPNAPAFYEKLGQREAQTIAIISIAFQGEWHEDGSRLSRASLALGAVAPTIVRATESEKELLGRPLDEERLARAAEKVLLCLAPISDVRGSAEYRREMCRRLTEANLRRVLGGGPPPRRSGTRAPRG